MLKHLCVVFFTLYTIHCFAQYPNAKEKDSVRRAAFFQHLGNGFLPIKYFNLDLKYLIKFNQYEGFRTGLGGVTNAMFSKRYQINSYLVYGFKDKRYKYRIGGGFRIGETSNTWIHLAYTDDLQETGSSSFLTDKRLFTFFEPRLLNIDLFHRHITKTITLEHKVSNNLLSELQLAVRKMDPAYAYNFVLDDGNYTTFDITTATISLQWNPFNTLESLGKKEKTIKGSYPKFTFQYTQTFKSVFGSDFKFSKLDFRAVQQFSHKNKSTTNVTLVAGVANGETPLTHLYHAYPNNITKETILQRFSVAGLNSFETMYFNEFFSDKFSTLQIKHAFKPFKISKQLRPQLVFISRYAIGQMHRKERHQGIQFNTLEKLYSESGFELNKLLLGFGLSFAYRYGGYHLSDFEDNIAFKFTFNVSL